VLLVPTGFSFLWMTVFGNTAMALDMGEAAGAIAAAVQADLSTALFQFLTYLPGAGITSALAVALVVVFFVTSADSGSLVIDTIASGGADDTPLWQRIYWCSLEGVAAALLLLAGGLTALQAATLVAALPFAVIMILLAWALYRGMSADLRGESIADEAVEAPLTVRLRRILVPTPRQDIETQIEAAATPALQAVCEALAAEGVEAQVARDADSVALQAAGSDGSQFVYRVRAVSQPLAAYSLLEASESRRTFEWRLHAISGGQGRPMPVDVTDFTREQFVSHVLEKLTAWRSGRRPQYPTQHWAPPAPEEAGPAA
jgi:choline/glycine/proline betaine transport protein